MSNNLIFLEFSNLKINKQLRRFYFPSASACRELNFLLNLDFGRHLNRARFYEIYHVWGLAKLINNVTRAVLWVTHNFVELFNLLYIPAAKEGMIHHKF